jgi:hypothetical protein
MMPRFVGRRKGAAAVILELDHAGSVVRTTVLSPHLWDEPDPHRPLWLPSFEDCPRPRFDPEAG